MASAKSVTAWRAPGRVNLIGEHTDYNDGFVLPVALDLGCEIKVTPISGSTLKAHSEQQGASLEWPLESIASAEPAKNWGDYVLGVAREVAALGYKLHPVLLEINATVPSGSGLSSSAALEVATALALLDGQSIDKLELARLCQRAERNFVGMPCGIMDQYASVFGEAGSAILLDCRSQTHVAVQLPAGVDIVVVNTMVKHELSGSAYRDRVRECAEALSHFPGKKALRDVTLGELELAAANMPEIPLSRARHIVLENWRVQQFRDAAAAGDLATMGRLFVESHRSLKDDYEVSCEELDYMVAAALRIDGVYGARMTGGGFGGCTVNLVRADAVDHFEKAIRADYQQKYNIDPAVYRCHPGPGAGPVL